MICILIDLDIVRSVTSIELCIDLYINRCVQTSNDRSIDSISRSIDAQEHL